MKRGARRQEERRKIGKDRGDENKVEPCAATGEKCFPVCSFKMTEFRRKRGVDD